jgi:hypothetical protein
VILNVGRLKFWRGCWLINRKLGGGEGGDFIFTFSVKIYWVRAGISSDAYSYVCEIGPVYFVAKVNFIESYLLTYFFFDNSLGTHKCMRVLMRGITGINLS